MTVPALVFDRDASSGGGRRYRATNVLFIDQANRRVGVGTDAPVDSLNVHNPLGATSIVRLTNTTTGGPTTSVGLQIGMFGKNATILNEETSGPANLSLFTQDGNVVIGAFQGAGGSPADVLLQTDGTTGLRVNRSPRRVGIGDPPPAAPSAQLHVTALAVAATAESIIRGDVSDDATSFFEINNATSTDGAFLPRIDTRSTAARSALAVRGTITDDTGTNAVMVFDGRVSPSSAVATRPLAQWQNNTSPAMTLAASGNLGVGVTAAVRRLHAAADNSFGSVRSERAQSSQLTPTFYEGVRYRGTLAAPAVLLANDQILEIRAVTLDTGLTERISASIMVTAAAAPAATFIPTQIDWRTTNLAGTLATRMTLTSEGDVGLGTSGPIAMLHLLRAAAAVDIRIESTSAGGIAGVRFFNPTKDWRAFVDGGNADGFAIRDTTLNITRLFITGAAGLVGIGNNLTSPLARLHVSENDARVAFFERLNAGDGTIKDFRRNRYTQNSGTVTAGDGVLEDWRMRRSDNAEVTVCQTLIFLPVVTAGSEEGVWRLQTRGPGAPLNTTIESRANKLGFFAATPVVKPTVTGSRGGNAALASLLTAVASLGLVTDSSTP